MGKSAAELLGNPEYLAICYGGYRHATRDVQPTLGELKEDLQILAAMGIGMIRTYNVKLPHASNVLKAIHELKTEDPDFEMYVMLGAWIDCLNAWTDLPPNHEVESEENEAEIARAVALAKQYPDVVKIISVGNEAMVHWQQKYHVKPAVILKWVAHLQHLKKQGELPKALWITSSDDYSSWGGGDPVYHTPDLEKLAKAVDYISMHTYPMHNTHYNPGFWLVPNREKDLPESEKTERAMLRAKDFAINQYRAVSAYVKSLGIDKPIHIGETGWATTSNGHYGEKGSRAADEYKSGVYHKHILDWARESKVACFYFEAFDECWKDAANPNGSENHFGLINLKGEAKYPLWDLVDRGVFDGLERGGQPITKTFGGDKAALMETVCPPPSAENGAGPSEGINVQVSGRRILVDGAPYLIKGICYHPVPKGCDSIDLGHLAVDLGLMLEAGVNTIRIYTPIDDKEVLDAIHAAGLKLIVGFGYNQHGRFDIRSGSYIDYIKKYKNHDAILMWELGNEYNYHPEWFNGDLKNWYETLNKAAETVHGIDTLHPVTTAHGDMPDAAALASCPNVDVWGLNVYRWDNPSAVFSEWETLSTKPMYLSETGGDSFMTVAMNGYEQGVNQTAQADANRNILDTVFKHQEVCSGVTLFSFLDGWWKAGDPGRQNPGGSAPNSGGVPYDGAANEEYWGIVDIDRNKKAAFEVVKDKYQALAQEKFILGNQH